MDRTLTVVATESLRSSIYDGMFANAFGTLTGGVFLTGFALYLGMNAAVESSVGAPRP